LSLSKLDGSDLHRNFRQCPEDANLGGVRVTPAMEAGLADHVWKIEELVGQE